MMKVIEDDLRQLLKQVSFHDTDWAMLQLDAASVLATFAPYFLSQQVPPLLNNLPICRLLNA